MTTILYVTRAKLSLSRASTYNIIKTAESLQRDGCSVKLFSAAPEDKSKDHIAGDKNTDLSFDLDIAPKKRMILWYVVRNRKMFDVLYFRDPFLFPSACLAKYVLRKKVIFEIHGNYEWRRVFFVWKCAVWASDALVFITSALQAAYASKKPSIVVHSNGVDVGAYTGDSKELRTKLQLPQDKKIVMYVGSFLWYSMDVLVDLAVALDQGACLIIVGAKEEEIRTLQQKAHAKNISDRMMYVSRVKPNQVAEYLCSADILVNPLVITYPGSISSKLYEYMAAGKPIVSTAGGANLEILRNNENAMIVELSGKAFAVAIKRLIDDAAMRDSLSVAARDDARKYTWEERAKRIHRLIDASIRT